MLTCYVDMLCCNVIDIIHDCDKAPLYYFTRSWNEVAMQVLLDANANVNPDSVCLQSSDMTIDDLK